MDKRAFSKKTDELMYAIVAAINYSDLTAAEAIELVVVSSLAALVPSICNNKEELNFLIQALVSRIIDKGILIRDNLGCIYSK